MGGLYTKLFGKQQIRILLQGLDGAGKTSILYRLKLGDIVTTIPTIGFNVETIEHQNIEITAWDIGGRDKARLLWRHYYANTRALVFIVDCNDIDESRIEQARDELHRALEDDELRDTILLVLANKQDLPNAWSSTKLSEELKLYTLGPRRIWNIFPTSALTGDGLYEALDWLASECKKNTKYATTDVSTDKSEETKDNGTESLTKDGDYFVDKIIGAFKRIFLARV